MRANISTVLLPLALLSLPNPAEAGGCHLGFCGTVVNNSPWTMWAADLGGGPKNSFCDVWNWDGGNNPSWQHKHCVQTAVAPNGGHRGGHGVDVDAICFADRKYKVKWFNGAYKTYEKGVWTKIATVNKATCHYSADGIPTCHIQNSTP